MNFLKKSLRSRLFLSYLSVGFIPFFALLLYVVFLSETKIVNNTIHEQLQRTDVVIKLIDKHINSLKKEVSFLSSLELMDDMLAEDIDKRISRLLTKKNNDLNLDTTLILINKNFEIIASSSKKIISKKLQIEQIKEKENTSFIRGSILYICSTVHASFDAKTQIGTLILEYNLNNLNSYLTHNKNIQSFIQKLNSNLSIGKTIPLDFTLNDSKGTFINDKYVIVYKKLLSILDDYYIVYAVDKNIAFEFLYDFMSLMLFMSFFILLTIIYLSLSYSKEIVKPIKELTIATDNIIKTHNYSTSLSVNTEDEIATLTNSFNVMLKTISSTLIELENEIQEIKKTKAASSAKSAFISTMSHELRTPLNSIIGSAQYLMVYENLSEDQIDSMGSIESSAQYLLGMINEILDIAKIEAGKMEIHKKNIFLLKEVQKCFEMLSPLAYDKNLSLELNSDNLTIKEFQTDSKILKQILINLLSNAIKFTQHGSIQIELYDDEQKIYISISDTGIGIAKDDLNKLFDDFSQLENEAHQKHAGTGLGLSISKKMAHLLNGNIVIYSDGLGFGSKSVFTLNKTKEKTN